MVETVTRKRLEILVDTPLVPRLVRYAREAGISGWSLLHVDAGGGRVGEWRNDEITSAAAKTIMLMIASETQTLALVETLAPLLESHGLLLTISDVQVVRGERFT
jgi:PII-like signaling protein